MGHHQYYIHENLYHVKTCKQYLKNTYDKLKIVYPNRKMVYFLTLLSVQQLKRHVLLLGRFWCEYTNIDGGKWLSYTTA